MKKHTILWADDDIEDMELMRHVFAELDYDAEMIEVHNGRQVLEHLQQLQPGASFPCLIILDMNMPILSGRETLAILKSETTYSSIPVVVFTTSSNEMDKRFCKQFATEMITKPPTYERLKKIVAKLLAICSHTAKP